MKSLALLALALQAVVWAPIASWSGDGTKETESFTVTQREWRLSWTATISNPAAKVRQFGVTVHKADDDAMVSIVSAGTAESGESYVRGAGRYYLKVSGINAKWTLTAEEPAKNN